MLDRIEFEAFLTLAEELHFGRTARRLLVTPGRVSQVIKRLEGRIGAPLFDRTSRSVRLTAVGRELYGALKPAYDDVCQAVRLASEQGHRGPRLIRAGFVDQWCGDLLQAAATRGCGAAGGDGITAGNRASAAPGPAAPVGQAPQVRVRVVEIDQRDVLGALRAGTIDVQLTELPVADPDVVAGPAVIVDRRALAVPASHRLAARAAITLEDLAGERLITVGDPADTPAHTPAHAVRHPRHTPSGRAIGRGPVVATWQDALVNVGAGRGVSLTSARAALYHGRPGVVYVPIIDAAPVEYALLWLRTGDHVRVHAFARLVAEAAAAMASRVALVEPTAA